MTEGWPRSHKTLSSIIFVASKLPAVYLPSSHTNLPHNSPTQLSPTQLSHTNLHPALNRYHYTHDIPKVIVHNTTQESVADFTMATMTPMPRPPAFTWNLISVTMALSNDDVPHGWTRVLDEERKLR